MKFFTLTALTAAAVLSAVVVVPFLPVAKKTNAGVFALEVRMASSAAGYVQVYYPDSAGGLSEAASSRLPLAQSSTPMLYRLPVPDGLCSTLRFDPIDREGTVTIETLRIIAQSGRGVRSIAFSELQPTQQIGSLLERSGRIEISTTPGASDPQVLITLNPPIELQGTFVDRCEGFWSRSLGVFVALAGLLLALDRTSRTRAAIAGATRRLAAQPGRAVAVVAAVAVIASAYPVIFLGKSHVSPNFGTHLLYDGFPTLPGSASGTVTNPPGSGRGRDDVGASAI